jgi:dipeptide transport system ATP-binding protein
MSAPLLEVKNLSVEFGNFKAVDNVSLSVNAGEVVGIVGESGSGKSVTALALMGLIDEPGRVSAQRLSFDGRDLLTMKPQQRSQMLGKDIAMIFQDPASSLNPCFTVAYQLMETLKIHEGGSKTERRARALQLLRDVEIPDAPARLDAYPHQLSGGMSQRVMLAMAMACRPRLLIADEPTTALDVTIQAQMLALLRKLQRERGMSLVLITHDLGVVAEVAQRVMVMYAGQAVENAGVPAIFNAPHHPYTEALMSALPEHNIGQRRLHSMAGVVPGASDRPMGCLLAPRCPHVQTRCRVEQPELTGLNGEQVRCFFPLNVKLQATT